MYMLVILSLLTGGVLFSWLLRKFGAPDVLGHIVGGIVAAIVLTYAGIDLEKNLIYNESLRWLGLTLFSFTIGISIGFNKIVENIHRVVSVELILYVSMWISSEILARVIGVNYVERIVLFVILINSSSVAVYTLIKYRLKQHNNIIDRIAIQTNIEDVVQFITFTIIFVAGASIKLSFLDFSAQLIMVTGLAILILTLARYLLKFLSRTSFIADKENKFLIAIGSAIFFASIASAINLPPLFGAFLAGLSFSIFLSLEDVFDMINGVKDLGLLMYFTSLGAQLYIKLSSLKTGLDVVSMGIVLGVIGFILRILSFSLAMIFTGNSVTDSVFSALFLSPISEIGIIFAEILEQKELISTNFAAGITIAIVVSIFLFSLLIPKTINKINYLEKLIPIKINNFFKYVSDLYIKRIDIAKLMLTPIIEFTATSLLIMYTTLLILEIIDRLTLPLPTTIILLLISSTSITLLLFKTLQTIFTNILKHTLTTSGKDEILGKMLDALVGILAIVLQLYIFYTITSRLSVAEPIYVQIAIITGVVIMIIAVYETIKYIIKIDRRRRTTMSN